MEQRKEGEYIRVGTTLYKVVDLPLHNGTTIKRRIPWSIGTIHQDYGKNNMPLIKKYNAFCTIPSHSNYQKEIGGCYNLYEPIDHTPVEGDFSDIIKLIKHIFGEQYEIGMDYMQLLYMQPIQKLPILLLVSEERNTGKTTFLNFLKAIFQDNATFNTNEDFHSQFNADWAGKLLIAIDEVLLNRREDSERLKNLSTAHTYKVEAKGKDRQEVDFFAKFVLCSNNEHTPIIIDSGETRYWVRKIEKLENDDTHFLDKLIGQIPAFLFYLQNRTLSTKNESRMWFSPSIIRTEALEKIINCSRNHTELDMVELLKNIFADQQIEEVSFTPHDFFLLLSSEGVRIEPWQITKVLKELWKLTPAPNAHMYTGYMHDWSNEPQQFKAVCNKKGRYYSVTKTFIESLKI